MDRSRWYCQCKLSCDTSQPKLDGCCLLRWVEARARHIEPSLHFPDPCPKWHIASRVPRWPGDCTSAHHLTQESQCCHDRSNPGQHRHDLELVVGRVHVSVHSCPFRIGVAQLGGSFLHPDFRERLEWVRVSTHSANILRSVLRISTSRMGPSECQGKVIEEIA